MKVLIGPIDLPHDVVLTGQIEHNPGIGGSEYHSIVLASILAERHHVTVWIVSGNLQAPFLDTKFELSPDDDFDLQISFTSKANVTTPRAYPLIAISHHPFDAHILALPNRTIAIANVGDYQLRSNQRFARNVGVRQLWLPVFLQKPLETSREPLQGPGFLVGHLSSLHPSKGFHDVLSGWMKYVSSGGTGSLEVIGGLSLYGAHEPHPEIPAEKTYGDKLLRIMGGSVHPSVKFLGRHDGGVASIIKQWDLAILNPKGFGEAATISLADCWRCAVPTIAGNRFGQRDYMNVMPILAASRPNAIATKLVHFSQNHSELKTLGDLSGFYFNSLFDRGVQSAEQWDRLVRLVPQGMHSEDLGITLSKYTLLRRVQVQLDLFTLRLHDFAASVLAAIRKYGRRK